MRVFGILTALSTPGFYFFIRHMDRQFAGDWTDYFGPLSLFTRSAIWNYYSFPIHFPWRCGGSDLMVNPQTRLFSPFILLDIFFPPQWAMLLTMIFLGILGSYGMFKLTKSLTGAILWVTGSWFALHFTEGHLTYAEMQLLPFVLLFMKTIEKKSSVFFLFSFFGILLLNGAIQAWLYSAVLVLCAFFAFPGTCTKVRQLEYRYVAKLIGIMLLVTSPKLIPVWITLKKREPTLDITVMSWKLLFTSLYYPWQEFRMAVTEGTPFVFHEYGCYLGWITTGLVLYGATKLEWRKSNARFALLFFLWLWVGCGWGTPFNPWLLLQKVPILNQAHLQSRMFILMFLFFIIIVSSALDQIKAKKTALLLSGLMILELFFVRMHITRFMEGPFGEPAPTAHTFIRSNGLDSTVRYGIPLSHYLKHNISATDCNERAFFSSQVKPNDDPQYKGEIYFEKGNGQARIAEFIPGKLTVSYETQTDSEITVNTNHLWGWKSLSSDVQVLSTRFGETLKVGVPRGSGTFTLVYRPKYLIPCLVLFLLGLAFYFREIKRIQTA